MGENMEMVRVACCRKLKIFKCAHVQFTMGGLFPSSTLLKMIEEIAAEDDAKLQKGFQVYDSCGKISMLRQPQKTKFILKTHN
jgi:hypothetical protein